MAMERNRLAAVGAFVILGVLLFAVGLFFIGDRRMLFNHTVDVYSEFANIAGLADGAKVRGRQAVGARDYRREIDRSARSARE